MCTIYIMYQGRNQELEMGAANLLGEGSGAALRSQWVHQDKALVGGGGGRGGKPPRNLWGFKLFPKKER